MITRKGHLSLSNISSLKEYFKRNPKTYYDKYGIRRKIHCLDVSNNVKITTLDGCPQVEILFCNNCSLTSLRGCPKNVKVLDVSYNPLTSLDGMPENLTDFVCHHTFLTNINGLKICDYMDLRYNKLVSVESLNDKFVRTIHLSYNNLDNLLGAMGVYNLYFYMNPCSKIYNEHGLIYVNNVIKKARKVLIWILIIEKMRKFMWKVLDKYYALDGRYIKELNDYFDREYPLEKKRSIDLISS